MLSFLDRSKYSYRSLFGFITYRHLVKEQTCLSPRVFKRAVAHCSLHRCGFGEERAFFEPLHKTALYVRGPLVRPKVVLYSFQADRNKVQDRNRMHLQSVLAREDPVLRGQRGAVGPRGPPEPALCGARRETGAPSADDTEDALVLPDFQWGGRRAPSGQKDGGGEEPVERNIPEDSVWEGGTEEQQSRLPYCVILGSLQRKALGWLEGRVAPSFAHPSPVPSVGRSPPGPSELVHAPPASAPSGAGCSERQTHH